jgi:hypothetical protein
MEPILCKNCFEFFPSSPRHKDQNYCMKPECRRAKKATCKRRRMDAEPKFKEEQQLINKKWAQNRPGYWKEYRKKNRTASNNGCAGSDLSKIRAEFIENISFVKIF